MDLRLHGKRALVTGSSNGIGEAIARLLASEGTAVVIHGRGTREAGRVAGEITAAGGKAAVACGDLASDDAAARVADQALAAFGGIDILVNNVGGNSEKPWLETTAADWLDLYNQNVGSMVRMIRRLVPPMKDRRWGRVITMASRLASAPLPDMAPYGASKAAVLNLAVSLAKELTGTGITVNAVSPGPTLTPGLEQSLRKLGARRGWPTEAAELESRFVAELDPNPTGRIGRVDDVAGLVVFLASPRAGYINGANLHVDGGNVPTIN